MANLLLERLRIQHPIILAPLAGGPSTPELAAAVSNAGGMGSLGLEYLTLDQMRQHIQRTRELTRGPINLNLFAPMSPPSRHLNFAPALAEVALAHEELGIAAPEAPQLQPDNFGDKLSVMLESRPEVFSFTFGMMSHDAMHSLKGAGIFVIGTATTVAEAQRLERAGVDAIVAQGSDAGGHRGTFAGLFDTSMIPTLDLVRRIANVTKLPVIASGGLMDGRDIRRALEAGAAAVQLGTAFLACPEAGTSKPYREALLNAREDTTVITRAFSGRPARGLANRFSRKLADKPDSILPFPLQNTLTRPMRRAAAEKGTSEYLSLWAGTGVARIRQMPAGELVKVLVDEMNAA
jgi:nitronate monooxygenase